MYKPRQRQSIRVKADYVTDFVFLPAHTTSIEQGYTHQWSDWEWSKQSRLSRGPTARIVSGFHCVHFAPGKLSLRRELSPVFLAEPAPFSPEGEQFRYCWGTAAIEIAGITHGSGGRFGDGLALSPPAIPRSSALSGQKTALQFFPLELEHASAAIFLQGDWYCFISEWRACCRGNVCITFIGGWGSGGRSSPNRVLAAHSGNVTSRNSQKFGVRVALPCQKLLAEGGSADCHSRWIVFG